MVQVSLHYDNVIHDLGGFNISDGTLDDTISSLKDFKQRVGTLELALDRFIAARESVTANLSVPPENRAKCEVYIYTHFSEYASKSVRAALSHSSQAVVEEAINQYISHAGVPSMVGPDSDYELASRVLEGYGKKLKTRFWDKGNGAHVVDNQPAEFGKAGLILRLLGIR